jgi:histidine ammonia-lyase
VPGSVALGDGLTVADVVAVARDGARAVLPKDARARMASSRAVVERALERGDPVYGLTTGVGALRDVPVGAGQAEFNRRLVTTHAVGHGPPAPGHVVRAAMLARAQGLARGGAGARPAVAEALCAALADGFTPEVHAIGSLGQADLGPLAEIAAALVGAGRLELEAREGLAFVNANAFAVGWGCLAHASGERAMAALDRSAALALEGFGAGAAPFDEAVAAARPYPGLVRASARLRDLLDGGELLRGRGRTLQDPLSFRVVPQAHGLALDALEALRATLETELASASDNPLVAGERILPTGNFDAAPVAFALDGARQGLAQAASLSAERVQKLLWGAFSGLPSGLRSSAEDPGDGLLIVGYGAVALAGEIALLAGPVLGLQPTTSIGEGIEERMTFAPVAARRLEEMARLVVRLAAVELAVAAEAVERRGAVAGLGRGTAAAHALVRASVAPFQPDGPLPSLDALETALRD